MVKCAECGFLAARDLATRELQEAEETFRESGIGPTIIDDDNRLRFKQEQLPLCFAQRYNLRDEFKEFAGKDSPEYLNVYHVVNEERECEAFTEWQQGFTPREHREMIDRERWREWQAKQEEINREWQEEESRKNRSLRIKEVAALAIGAPCLVGLFSWLISKAVSSDPVQIFTSGNVTGL